MGEARNREKYQADAQAARTLAILYRERAAICGERISYIGQEEKMRPAMAEDLALAGKIRPIIDNGRAALENADQWNQEAIACALFAYYERTELFIGVHPAECSTCKHGHMNDRSNVRAERCRWTCDAKPRPMPDGRCQNFVSKVDPLDHQAEGGADDERR